MKKVSHKVQSKSEPLQKIKVGKVKKRAKRMALGYVRSSQNAVWLEKLNNSKLVLPPKEI